MFAACPSANLIAAPTAYILSLTLNVAPAKSLNVSPSNSLTSMPLANSPNTSVAASPSCVKPSVAEIGNSASIFLNSSNAGPVSALTTLSAANSPASAIFNKPPAFVSNSFCKARAIGTDCSRTDLSSWVSNLDRASPCVNWTMAPADSCALAPPIRRPMAKDSVRSMTFC